MIIQSPNHTLDEKMCLSTKLSSSVAANCVEKNCSTLPQHLRTYPHSQSIPQKPCKFPKPSINSCKRLMVQKDEGQVQVIVPKCKRLHYAYWLQKSKRATTYGNLWRAVILVRGDQFHRGQHWHEWKVTNIKCAVKEFENEKLKDRKNSYEDPHQEIAAMQYLKTFMVGEDNEEDIIERAKRNRELVLASHVMSPLDAMKSSGSSKSIYLTMTYIEGGDLIDQMDCVDDYGFSEDQCRCYMADILRGIECLQRAGICHRDISAENILVSKEGVAVIADFGMCLKIPYVKQNRCLIKDQKSCGKIYCTPPEVIQQLPFDGYAADLWALGPILFKMRTGGALPWEKACLSYNLKFKYFQRGRWNDWVELLTRSRTSDDIVDPVGTYLHDCGFSIHTLSPECLDLLTKICRCNPEQRLSLKQISEHAWFQA